MNKILVSLLTCLAATLASAHVSLVPDYAEAGAPYRGMLRIGHGCEGASTTTVELQLPDGTRRVLEAKDGRELPVEFTAPAKPGAVWIKAVQRCGASRIDWSQVPPQGTSTEGMKTPAMLLRVMTRAEVAAWRMRPAVEDAWVRASVPGQQSTGAFMRITANEPTQLVGASSPLAGIAQVHEMRMEGEVMRMRAAGAIDLPVGRPFELKPGGYHLMLQDLKQPLAAGSAVPLTLVFRNARGEETRIDLRVPVAVLPPAGHKH